VNRTYQVGPKRRYTIYVDQESSRLANTAVSITVRSTNGVPVIVERAMWWPGRRTAPTGGARATARRDRR
jgi:hypothetical protein